jgi:hypothetical protein
MAHRLSLQNKAAVVLENEFRTMREKVREIWRAYMEA